MKPVPILFSATVLAVSFLIAPSLALADESPYYLPDLHPPSASPAEAAVGPFPWNFNMGGGPAPVVGGTRNELTSGWNFVVGGGYNFTPGTGLNLEFMESGLVVTSAARDRNQATDGHASVWSLTLNPVWRYRIAGPVGGYIIGGGGFYEHAERFDEAVGAQTVHQVDDTGGLNIGTGITFNLGRGAKFYMEVRYHYIFTSGVATQLLPVTFGFRW